MQTSSDIDFKQIVTRLGSKQAAFEELCCRLAARSIPEGANYVRLDGAGGDGGVECFADMPGGSRVGWQAKYVFDIDRFLRQSGKSLTTALQVHGALTRYVLCCPFDLTGPTGRTGRSGLEKFAAWQQVQVNKALDRELEIEIWTATKLRDLLLRLDEHGGMRSYFFDSLVISEDWFEAHIESAKEKVTPRYSPELHVGTEVAEWFSAFGRTRKWLDDLEKRRNEAKKVCDGFRAEVERATTDMTFPSWPTKFKANALELCAKLEELSRMSAGLLNDETRAPHAGTLQLLNQMLTALSDLDKDLSTDLEAKYGHGTADSPGFRQHMREYEVSFPAHNLDELRKVRKSVEDLTTWLETPQSYLGFRKAFILSGGWGVGKTHTACHVGDLRKKHGLLTCLTFGHEFNGEPDPWTRLAESLGQPPTLGRDKLLSALDCAAEASGFPLLLFIDAINETSPRRYWYNNILSLVKEIKEYRHLRICITCRTPFIRQCIPDGHGLDVIEHPGFKGIERKACRAFFGYYNLQPPLAPILQPELSVPLYLKIVCDTLVARGDKSLPVGWSSMGRVVGAFLRQKEQEFAIAKGISSEAQLVTQSLLALANALADSVISTITWSDAGRIVGRVDPRAVALDIVEWLKGEELLIEGGLESDARYDSENTLRLSFERLGDFLLAKSLLNQVEGQSLADAFGTDGMLQPLIRDSERVDENKGIWSALSILIPEGNDGTELPQFIEPGPIRDSLLEITITSLSGRDPTTFSEATRRIIWEGLAIPRMARMAMDGILAVAWQPSAVDARWLHRLLVAHPLAHRDALWCRYLHCAYEASGPPWRLIHAAFDLPIEELDVNVAERWATILTWFTAAADRRVKDGATRALMRVLTKHPGLILVLIPLFLKLDDDAVRQRVLLGSYGALLASRDQNVIAEMIEAIYQEFAADPKSFNNALIRDQIRLLAELARQVKALPDERDPEFTFQPISSEWPLEIPNSNQVKAWSNMIHFTPKQFVSDFFKYSMNCLCPWEESISRDDMGKWIVQRIARDFEYVGSNCDDYDTYMLGKFGGGRDKPVWAERIGKKYQWMAMYQLASRLNDHIDRKEDSWKRAPMRKPLILLEARKLDPTLPHTNYQEARRASPWWIEGSVEFDFSELLSHEEWIAKSNDLPSLETMIATVEMSGQAWHPLCLNVDWTEDRTAKEQSEPYRHAGLQVQCYLVPEVDLESAYRSLSRNNVSWDQLPKAAEWNSGFLGEYPWATPFNTEPDEWHRSGGTDVSVLGETCWNRIGGGWGYDGSNTLSSVVTVPTKTFFSRGDLWWDGRDGYRNSDGLTVFRDPSVTEGGPITLLADAQDFPIRLKSIGRCLIWVMLGHKMVLGGRSLRNEFPRLWFRQVAQMHADGSIREVSKIFTDH